VCTQNRHLRIQIQTNLPRRPLQGRFPKTENPRWRKCPPPTIAFLWSIIVQSMIYPPNPVPRCAPKIATYERNQCRICHLGLSRAVFPKQKNPRWKKCPPPTIAFLWSIIVQSMIYPPNPVPRCAPKIATYERKIGRTCHGSPSRAVFQKQEILGGKNALHLRLPFCNQLPFNQ
jgi:hypothetical protein